MLWQKETDTGHFTDIFKNLEYPENNRYMYRKKNNTYSQRLRAEGNKKYSEKNFDGAWIKYNEAVCFAENNSQDLAFAYANRSMCFIKLGLYNQCLLDIELAKGANYPDHLMAKLSDRERECILNSQSSVQKTPIEPFLSFAPDNKLPCMTNILQIETSQVYGRLVKAKCDIKVGETLLIEQDFIRTVDSDLNNYCTYCGKARMNFIPCKNCADATFCNMECMNNNFHETECDMMMGTNDICDGQSLSFILRSIIIGINTFPTINEMMKLVENWQSTHPSEISTSCETPTSKYRTFFNLASFISDERILAFRKITYFIFSSLMGSSKMACKFKTTAEKRFLLHLIVHHGLIIRTNSFSFEEEGATIHELALLTSYFNHSCLPNIAKLTKGNLSIIKAILPIKQGDQLFLTYINGEVFDMTGQQRNDNLNNTYGFRCKCKLCTHGRLQAGDLENDPSFIYVSSNVLDDQFVDKNVSNIIKHCTKFLIQHTDKIGSKEVAYIADIVTVMFSKELQG